MASRLASSDRAGPRGHAAAAIGPARGTILDSSILVIEDEAMIAWLIEGLLEELGFADIRLAANARQAQAMAERAAPTLILSDINLGSGPDGIETAAAIQRAAAAPVIFVTAYGDEATRARIAREVPGAPLLRKPFTADSLRQAIFAALDGRAAN